MSSDEESSNNGELKGGSGLTLEAPKLLETDVASVRKFFKQYDRYTKVFQDRIDDGSLGQGQMPLRLSRCLDPDLLMRLCWLELEVEEDELTEEQLLAHLKSIVEAQATEIDLGKLLAQVKFDPDIHEPREKVGRAFQQARKLLKDNNAEKVFAEKKVCEIIVGKVKPAQLRQRVEYFLSTEKGKDTKKSLLKLYKCLVDKYTLWYEIYPDGREGRNAGGDSKPYAKEDPGDGNHNKHKKKKPGRNKRERGDSNTPAAGDSDKKKSATTPKDGSGCWHCKGSHFLSDCPTATPEQKKNTSNPKVQAYQARKLKWDQEKGKKPKETSQPVRGEEGADEGHAVIINGVMEARGVLDTQATRTIISQGLLEKLRRAAPVTCQRVEPVEFELGDDHVAVAEEIAYLDLQLQAAHAPIMIRRVRTYVLPGVSDRVLFGIPELDLLEYQRPVDWLDDLSKKGALDISATEHARGMDNAEVQRACRVAVRQSPDDVAKTWPAASSDDEDVPEEGMRKDAVLPPGAANDALEKALMQMVQRAEQNGAPKRILQQLKTLVLEYQDVFRLELGHDPPASVEPMRIELIDEAEVFGKTQHARRFAPLQMDFLDQHVKLLMEMGVVQRSCSAFASPIVLVRKKDGGWRMCVDLRRVNSNTKPMRWPLPKIQELLPHLVGASFFATFDLLRGFWQFPVSEESKQYLAFVTHKGLYEFERVVMGARNSAAHFQKVMTQVLQHLILQAVLVYIDDLLCYAKTAEELVEAIEAVFVQMRRYGIKLKPSKCELFARVIVWCGWQVSEKGVGVNPEFVATVCEMVPPTDGAQLQQFLASCNWLRSKIPQYAELVSPLQALLTKGLKGQPKRNKHYARKVNLLDLGWTAEHDKAYAAIKDALRDAVTTAHLDPEKIVCLFPDASEGFWGSILTQVPVEDVASSKDIADWRHEPLGFLSGSFKGASLRWGIPDKEGFAIVESCRKFSHFLVRDKGFRIYTDHRNLKFIFNPRGVVSQVSKPQADRLERWAVFLRAFDYVIEHVPGEVNVWADMLSRWAPGSYEHILARELQVHKTQRSPTVLKVPGAESDSKADDGDHEYVRMVQLRVRRDRVLDEEAHTNQRIVDEVVIPAEEEWPTLAEIIAAQRKDAENNPAMYSELTQDEEGAWRKAGAIYIPSGYCKLRARITVVAHAGAAGHRGSDVTQKLLRDRFYWPEMTEEVNSFLRGCLLCAKTQGGKVKPRPLGKALAGKKPGESLHMDYLSLTEAWEGMEGQEPDSKGVLVSKDGFGGYVLLAAANKFDAKQTETSAVEWASIFGVPDMLVTDGGTHFDNTVIQALCKRFRTKHHITTAYAPWANGAVERVNREVVKLFRVLLAETGLPKAEWPRLLPLVQSILNQQPSRIRAGLTPAQVQMGRATPRPIDTIAKAGLDATCASGIDELSLAQKCKSYYEATAAAMQASWLATANAQKLRHEQNKQQREKQREGVQLRTEINPRQLQLKHKGHGKKAKNKRTVVAEVEQFPVGSYVLVYTSVPRNKLRIQWLGPYKVAGTINENVYNLEDIVTHKTRTVHAQRMKVFADQDFEVTEDIRSQAAYDTEFNIEKFMDWRETDEATLELRVRWLGFEANEDSWEPLERMHADVPETAIRFMKDIEKECPLAEGYLRSWGKWTGQTTTRRKRRAPPRK